MSVLVEKLKILSRKETLKGRIRTKMMHRVREAKWRRNFEQDGKTYSEIEVRMQGREEPLLATLEHAQNGSQLKSLVRVEADPLLDWYNNDLHQAYTDISAQLFDGADLETNWMEKEAFVNELLELEPASSRFHRPGP